MDNELFYQLALALVPHIGDVQTKILVRHLGSATAVFRTPIAILEKIEGIGTVRARSIKQFRDYETVENEMRFIEKNGIHPVFLTDPGYPQKLLNCYDAPSLLFCRGSTVLNHSRVIAIVGTRSHTEYGRQFVEKLVRALASCHVVIVSGLAWGIDALAHRAAIANNMTTIGVVGHGLDIIYPPDHTPLAREMIREGGSLLTEFFSGTRPDKHHFPLRNRIVAGLSDATVVIETKIRGGSMITANLADAYNRDVFAVPGRSVDKFSSGCNHLIKHNKAMLLEHAEDLLRVMGWIDTPAVKPSVQRQLFIELSPEEKIILQLLREKEQVHIDEMHIRTSLSSSVIAAAILNLEIQGVIRSLPGKIYRME